MNGLNALQNIVGCCI